MSTIPKPGDRLSWPDWRTNGDRQGTVLDRAPHDAVWGWKGGSYGNNYDWLPEGGIWYWVIPDERRAYDADFAIRVRYYSKGQRAGQAFEAEHTGRRHYDFRQARSLAAHRERMGGDA